MSKPIRLVIDISGGMIQTITADTPDIDIIVIDSDLDVHDENVTIDTAQGEVVAINQFAIHDEDDVQDIFSQYNSSLQK